MSLKTGHRHKWSGGLFRTITLQALGNLSESLGTTVLSGVLIGGEIFTVPRGVAVALTGNPILGPRYTAALHLLRSPAHVLRVPTRELTGAVVAGHTTSLTDRNP